MAYKEKKLNGKADVNALYNALGMPENKSAAKKPAQKKPAAKKKK